jgi:hypothetical protein
LELDYEEFTALLTRFDREAIHLEMRDSYGTAVELPHMAKWAAGEADDLQWLRPWCDEVRANVAQGKVYRRAASSFMAMSAIMNCRPWTIAVAIASAPPPP